MKDAKSAGNSWIYLDGCKEISAVVSSTKKGEMADELARTL